MGFFDFINSIFGGKVKPAIEEPVAKVEDVNTSEINEINEISDKRFESEMYMNITDNVLDKTYDLQTSDRYDFIDSINELNDNYCELKEDNDIKFWKIQTSITMHNMNLLLLELNHAIKEGYTPSEYYNKYIKRIEDELENNKEKMERLGV